MPHFVYGIIRHQSLMIYFNTIHIGLYSEQWDAWPVKQKGKVIWHMVQPRYYDQLDHAKHRRSQRIRGQRPLAYRIQRFSGDFLISFLLGTASNFSHAASIFSIE